MVSLRAVGVLTVSGVVLSGLLAAVVTQLTFTPRIERSLPSNCRYQTVQCVKAPCDRVMVCDQDVIPPPSTTITPQTTPSFKITPPFGWQPNESRTVFTSPERDRVIKLMAYNPTVTRTDYCFTAPNNQSRCEWIKALDGNSYVIDWGIANTNRYYSPVIYSDTQAYQISLESTTNGPIPDEVRSKNVLRNLIQTIRTTQPSQP